MTSSPRSTAASRYRGSTSKPTTPRGTTDAQQQGIPIDGENGLLKQLTKLVHETASQGEMDAHLGYRKHSTEVRNGGNSRNGSRSKKVVTGVGPVEVEVPSDRDAWFEPKIVAKHQRRLSSVGNLVISADCQTGLASTIQKPVSVGIACES